MNERRDHLLRYLRDFNRPRHRRFARKMKVIVWLFLAIGIVAAIALVALMFMVIAGTI